MLANILDLSIPALEGWIASQGLKQYLSGQILQWLYQKRVASFDEMTNLSRETRALLAGNFRIGRLEVKARHRSTVDRSTKYLFRLADGKSVESVLMPQKNRLTLCVSSQVGCAMGCKFCRTAEMKLLRNLTQGEILAQILETQRELADGERVSDPRITNIVFMGMGEPLHNYEAVLSSLRIMTDPKGIGISRRKITVSTVGLAPEIERFGSDAGVSDPGVSDPGVKLALSLNATTEEGRLDLMPITRKYPLKRVLEACRNYTRTKPGRRVTLEYVMMGGVNDSLADAKRVAEIGSHLPCKINLIPYNEYPSSPYKRPAAEKIDAFFHYLADRHFQVNIRYSKGLDVNGACGQLCSLTPS